MTEQYMIESLTETTVEIVLIKTVEVDGTVYPPLRERKVYINCPTGRIQLSNELPEKYTTAILALWGDTAKLADPPINSTTETAE